MQPSPSSSRSIDAGLALSSLTIAQDAEMPLRQMSRRVFSQLTRLDGSFLTSTPRASCSVNT
jgi:hypothetical protein